MTNANADAHRIQAERVKRLLADLGISASELAREIGCSPAAVSQWATGKRLMRPDSARLIEGRYPLYSSEWLLGKTDYQSLARVVASALKDLSIEPTVAATMTLAAAAGFTLLTPFDTAIDISASAQALYDGHDMQVTIDGTDQTLTLGQVVGLAEELTDFAAVRLRHMLADHD